MRLNMLLSTIISIASSAMKSSFQLITPKTESIATKRKPRYIALRSLSIFLTSFCSLSISRPLDSIALARTAIATAERAE